MINVTYTFSLGTEIDPVQMNQDIADLIANIKKAHHSDADGTKILPADIGAGWGLIPSGGIIEWSGSIASIPAGYVFCNGANGTPDKRGKFSLNAISDGDGVYYPGATGGEINHTLITSEMPSHTHTDAGHSHQFPFSASSGGSASYEVRTATGSSDFYWGITASANIQNTGGDGAHNNMPPFLVSVFIMKS